MAPHAGLVHLKEYDIKDSNVELIGSSIDHAVKYASATSEPAWNDGRVGVEAGVFMWRIEDFGLVPWPVEKGRGLFFYDGDSYIVLSSISVRTTAAVGDDVDRQKLVHDIFFWLGSHTSQDEAGVAAYKTVELDEFLHGAATQHRELQRSMSDAFLELFPRLTIRSGGVRSGFRHVGNDQKDRRADAKPILLRVFKPAQGGAVVVCEVEPTWQSLDEGDVFILDVGDKIWVWQGSKCSPMEKAKAAQVVHDMKLAKHVEEEVLSQMEPRSRVIVKLLGGGDEDGSAISVYSTPRPVASSTATKRPRRLCRLSDAAGELTFELVREGREISRRDLDADDVFLFDDEGRTIWVWEGSGASKAEKALWLKVAQAYIRKLANSGEDDAGYLAPIAKVREGYESVAFARAIEAS
jgi:gelsolin